MTRKRPLKTLVVCGVDEDLLVVTQQHVLRARSHEVASGIRVLKQAAGIDDVVILTLKETVQGYGHIGGRVLGVDPVYPSAHPSLVMHQLFGREVPAGQTPEDLGFCFMRAEAVAAVGAAFETGRIPVTKVLTLIARDGSARLVETLIGTRVGDIFERYGIAVAAGDRIVLGGPMRGRAAYSLDQPVQPDTDAVMVLDAASASQVSEYPCVNCGECVRVCPARMQINLLVRYLEAGKYEDGSRVLRSGFVRGMRPVRLRLRVQDPDPAVHRSRQTRAGAGSPHGGRQCLSIKNSSSPTPRSGTTAAG